MEQIRKIISISSCDSFFFDADVVTMIKRQNYLGWYDNIKFQFDSITKIITIFYPIENIYTPNESKKYEITYHSIKDERKLKLQKINASI